MMGGMSQRVDRLDAIELRHEWLPARFFSYLVSLIRQIISP